MSHHESPMLYPLSSLFTLSRPLFGHEGVGCYLGGISRGKTLKLIDQMTPKTTIINEGLSNPFDVFLRRPRTFVSVEVGTDVPRTLSQ